MVTRLFDLRSEIWIWPTKQSLSSSVCLCRSAEQAPISAKTSEEFKKRTFPYLTTLTIISAFPSISIQEKWKDKRSRPQCSSFVTFLALQGALYTMYVVFHPLFEIFTNPWPLGSNQDWPHIFHFVVANLYKYAICCRAKQYFYPFWTKILDYASGANYFVSLS